MGLRVFVFLLVALAASAQPRLEEYALVMEEPPVAARIASRQDLQSVSARAHLQRIEQGQRALRSELAQRGIAVTAAAQTLVNAVFVRATAQQAAGLRGLPGVARVERLVRLKPHMNKALDLVRAPQAWNLVGGIDNAGAGVKIGILDSGIDQTHPAFQDASLRLPPGFPKGPPEFRQAYTNGKVIVARSYVAQLPFADVQAVDSRPDDTTPRDRAGHGTAAAFIAAGRRVQGPTGVSVSGVAPKAWLGSYKIFGSPGVNDSTTAPVMIQALTDALSDGMDIVTLSLGGLPFYAPLDRKPECGGGSNICDVLADAVENAVKSGLTVVVSAGNDGDIALPHFPTFNTINTPGTAPSAITVGGSTNAHQFFQSVRIPGTDVPSNLQRINGLFGNGPVPDTPLSAPLRDVRGLQDDGFACSALGNGTLAGAIAVVQRGGNCFFDDKVHNAERAGAAGVIIIQSDGVDSVFRSTGLTETGIRAILIGSSDGTALRNFLSSNPDRNATLDAALVEQNYNFPDEVASFSSLGPSIGSSSQAPIKPEMVAVATSIYTAGQAFDPNGELYSQDRFVQAQGNSFSVAMVAGAAAIVKQRNSGFGPARIKSALVNSANPAINEDGGAQRASVAEIGAGKLDANAAAQTVATVDPPVASFGVVPPGSSILPLSLTLTNTSNAAATFAFSVDRRTPDSRKQVTITPSSLTLGPGASDQISARLEGAQPVPGFYEGAVVINTGNSTLRVPYQYLVGDGVPYNLFPLSGDGFLGIVNETGWLMSFKVIDQFGAPVANAPVRFRVISGGGSINEADATTDVLGIAAANVTLGPTLGNQQFRAELTGGSNLTVDFLGTTRAKPLIDSNGVTNAASFQVGGDLAPGSYVTIRGQGFSQSTRVASTASLPVSLLGVSVSFDAPGWSLPGRLHFVSPSQINVQIPWELQGLNSAQMKVAIGPGPNDATALYTIPLADASPAFFEYDDAAGGRRLIAALDSGFNLLTVANPARRGAIVSLYANGLGPVDNQPMSGEPSPASPLATTKVLPTVSIGGAQAEVLFSGLTPNSVGLYQLNVRIPADAPAGLQPVVVNINGVSSKTATLAIQ